jgi:hypothetical protein
MTETRPTASIIIGERHRKDLGDIAWLAASIARSASFIPSRLTRTDSCWLALGDSPPASSSVWKNNPQAWCLRGAGK